MEQMEIHPINTRVVCLNQHHLKPVWILKALSCTLGPYYNNKELQVVWARASVPLPCQKSVRIRGHTSHPVATEVPQLKTVLKTGTYLTFHIPKKDNNDMHSYKLVISGVEPAVRTQNFSKVRLEVVTNQDGDQNVSTQESPASPKLEELSLNNLQYKNQTNQSNRIYKSNYHDEKEDKEIEIDFNNVEKIVTLLEEEDNISSSDESDSDDIHKVIRRRIVVDIDELVQKWKFKFTDDLLVLLLKPGECSQAWQFRSVWISATLRSSTPSREPDLLTPKKCTITRTRPVSSPHNFSTLNTRRRNPLNSITEELKEQIDPSSDIEVAIF